MDSAQTTSVGFLRVLHLVGGRARVDVGEVFAEMGIPPAVVGDPDARVPVETMRAAWREVGGRSGDAAFGLHAAERLQIGEFGLLDYLSRASLNLGEAMVRVARFSRVMSDASHMSLITTGGVARFVEHATGAPAQLNEFFLALVILRARQLTGADCNPRSVAFMHPAPADLSEHRRIFRAPLHFDQPVNEIVLDADLLDLPFLNGEPPLAAILSNHAESLASRLATSDALVTKVCEVLHREAQGGKPSLTSTARTLALSRRSLQRKLRENGVSWNSLVDQVRREIALHSMLQRGLSVSEVAYLLGFSEASAFHRAFKRWTGKTPRDFLRA